MDIHDASLEPSIRSILARAQNLPTGPARAREARALIQRLACLQERARGQVPDALAQRLDDLQRQLASSMFDAHTPTTPSGRPTTPPGRPNGRPHRY